MTLREMADVRCSCRNILNHFNIVDRLAKLFQQKWAVFEDGPHYVAGGVFFDHTERLEPVLSADRRKGSSVLL